MFLKYDFWKGLPGNDPIDFVRGSFVYHFRVHGSRRFLVLGNFWADPRKQGLIFGLMFGLLSMTGCLPTVVIIDRPSVIEEESAGEWMDVEQELSLLHARIQPPVHVRERSRVTRRGSGDEAGVPAMRFLPTGGNQNQGTTSP